MQRSSQIQLAQGKHTDIWKLQGFSPLGQFLLQHAPSLRSMMDFSLFWTKGFYWQHCPSGLATFDVSCFCIMFSRSPPMKQLCQHVSENRLFFLACCPVAIVLYVKASVGRHELRWVRFCFLWVFELPRDVLQRNCPFAAALTQLMPYQIVPGSAGWMSLFLINPATRLARLDVTLAMAGNNWLSW